MAQRAGAVLVHLAAGIGNLVLATPLLLVLQRAGFVIDLLLDCDYPAAAALFRDWGAVRTVLDGWHDAWAAEAYRHVIPAVPPFYWPRYAARYVRIAQAIARPPEDVFYRDEQSSTFASPPPSAATSRIRRRHSCRSRPTPRSA